jgi:hypothetical protein
VEYVTDEYVQPELPEEHVNVDCVLSWRRQGDAVLIDFRNGWIFNSDDWRGRDGARDAVLAALRRNEAGKRGAAVTNHGGADASAAPCGASSAPHPA